MNSLFEIYNSKHYKFISEKMYIVGGYTTFVATIKNYDFSGIHQFCMTAEDIKSILDDLTRIGEKLSGNTKITDTESTSFILIDMDKTEIASPKVKVSGELGMCFGDNFFKFEMNLDQTIIKLLFDCLNEFIIQ